MRTAQLGPIHTPDDRVERTTRRKATLTVCYIAGDAVQALVLLEVLGLDPRVDGLPIEVPCE